MITIKINNIEFLVRSNLSVLEACKYVGINIPRFCYHESLSVAGNCRMCLVEIEKSVKPVASCALPLSNNIIIYTDTPLVKKARENILETLLLNHPLDCPICDQAGECDLQDQTKLFGGDYSRSFINKRSVEDKYCGPLIQTIMTRCIHCTRCVRFCSEIAGIESLGTLNRGGSTEIGSYFSNDFFSEVSGNLIDLCPVGALTAKPYAFKFRPWELKSSESIDCTDSFGANIYVNFKESQIVRVLPKNNFDLNNTLISDKARFSYDSVYRNRINNIYYKKKNNLLKKSNWKDFFKRLKEDYFKKVSHSFKPIKITFVVDEEKGLKSLNLLNLFKNINFDFFHLRYVSLTHKKTNFFVKEFNDSLNSISSKTKICCLFAINIKIESALLNVKLRLKSLNEEFSLYSFGLNYNLNYQFDIVNLHLNHILNLFEGKETILSNILIKENNSLFIFGNSFYKRVFNQKSIFRNIRKYFFDSIIFDVSHFCNTQGLNLFNFNAITKQDVLDSDFVFCLDLDDTYRLRNILNFDEKNKITNPKIIWINSNGSFFALNFDYILPTATFFEFEDFFLNFEQKTQKALKINNYFKDVFDLPNVLIACFDSILKFRLKTNILNNNNLDNNYSNNIRFILNANKKEKILSKNNLHLNSYIKQAFVSTKTAINYYPVKSNLKDFYRSNKFTKNSIIMSDCSKDKMSNFTNFK
jgi:NADH-quinone oxidoreductase subunit G